MEWCSVKQSFKAAHNAKTDQVITLGQQVHMNEAVC